MDRINYSAYSYKKGEITMTKITVPKELVDLGRVSEDSNQFDDLIRRELDVIHLLVKGMSNREIGEELYLATGTVRIYLSNIYVKLGVNSRTQATIIAIKNGL